jgi:hypothetical protein
VQLRKQQAQAEDYEGDGRNERHSQKPLHRVEITHTERIPDERDECDDQNLECRDLRSEAIRSPVPRQKHKAKPDEEKRDCGIDRDASWS